MAVESVSLSPGTLMPAFQLPDPYGKIFSSNKISGPRGLLIVFTCNHCPYAKAIWPKLVEIAKEYQERGIHTIAINSNINPDYPEDHPEKMKEYIKTWNIDFPYLVDETQEVADRFDAQCTPDLYVYSSDAKLFYHGRFDEARKELEKASGRDLREALNALLAGENPPEPQYPSIGCSIKWVK